MKRCSKNNKKAVRKDPEEDVWVRKENNLVAHYQSQLHPKGVFVPATKNDLDAYTIEERQCLTKFYKSYELLYRAGPTKRVGQREI